MLSREISLQRSLKFDVGSRHFGTNAQRPGRARPLSVTSFHARDFALSVFILEVMADLQPYRFEQERVPYPEDSESENEEVNDRLDLEGTFWCTCERCEIMLTQKNVFVAENSQLLNKVEGRILCLYCIGRSKWKQFSLSS